jgi:glycosyltransferase involved in cell wall biosynthesis
MHKPPTVLMIAYYFPPMGGAGVQRTQKFVKYLPEYGWRTHVLTVRASDSVTDASLVEELPSASTTTRVAYLGLPTRLPWRVRNFITRWFLFLDEQIGWLQPAINAGKKIIGQDPAIKVIYSTSAPYTAHLVARQLHRQLNMPWVADFRDPWVENPFIKFPTIVHRQINEHLEKSIFFEADRVILNTELCRERYIHKYPSQQTRKMIVLPNGYDQADLPSLSYSPQVDTFFNVVHIGSLYQKTRSSEYFLKALSKAIQEGRIPSEKIQVRFIGIVDKETKGLIDKYGVRRNITLLGYIPHQKTIDELYRSGLLLLIPSYGKGAELFIPAKTYEYLACKKPILCLADPGGCADLVLKARAGSVVPPTDIDKITDQLVEMYHLWERGELLVQPDMDFISSFECRKLTGRLAGLLNEAYI